MVGLDMANKAGIRHGIAIMDHNNNMDIGKVISSDKGQCLVKTAGRLVGSANHIGTV